MKSLISAAILLLLAGSAVAQQSQSISGGTVLPTTCQLRQVFWLTLGDIGLYECSVAGSPGTWRRVWAGPGLTPAGASGTLQTNNGSGNLGAYGGTTCAPNFVQALDASGAASCAAAGTGTVTSLTAVAPATITPDPTTTTGTIGFSATPTSCTNQVVTAISSSAVGSCSTVTNAMLANDATTVNGQTCTLGSTCTIAVGTVTSVAQTVPVEFNIAGSPITTSGTLAITKATQSANTVWAGPTTGAAADPAFRALVTADLPAGTGTVTSVATSAPITGGTITTTGTIACATCNAMTSNPYVVPSSVATTGGLIGGAVLQSAGSLNSPFGTTTSNGNSISTPQAAWLRNLAINFASAQAAGAVSIFGPSSETTAGAVTPLLAINMGTVAASNTVTSAPVLARYTAGENIGIYGNTRGSVTPTSPTGWSTEFVLDSGGLLIGTYINATVATSATTYNGFGQSGNLNTTEAIAATPSPLSGTQTVRKFCFTTNTTQDGSGTLVATVMVNGSATSITATQGTGVARGYFCDYTNTASVSGTQTISVRFVNNASAGTTTVLHWSAELVPASGTPGVIFGGVNAAVTSGSTTYYTLFTRVSNSTEANVRVPMARAGTTTSFCIQRQVAASAGTTTATLFKNGSASGQLTMTIGNATGVQCATGSVAIAAGDTLTMEVKNSSACTAGCPTLGGWSVDY